MCTIGHMCLEIPSQLLVLSEVYGTLGGLTRGSVAQWVDMGVYGLAAFLVYSFCSLHLERDVNFQFPVPVSPPASCQSIPTIVDPNVSVTVSHINLLLFSCFGSRYFLTAKKL